MNVRPFVLVLSILLVIAVLPFPVWGTTGTLVITMNTTLSEDHFGNIIIDADNITLDCAGHAVTGSGSGTGILIQSKTGVTVKNCNVSNFRDGIVLRFGSGNTLQDNTASGNDVSGFIISNTSDNTLTGNTARDNGSIGFNLGSASDNAFTENTARNNGVNGFLIFWAGPPALPTSGNTFTRNIAIENGFAGFAIGSARDNTLMENTASSNAIGFNLFTFSVTAVSGNTIFHNNIIDNTVQASDANRPANNWHHPDLLEGNFWSDYPGVDDGSGTAKHAIAGDGIGDTNLPWPGTDFDNYPFIEENGWETPEPPIEPPIDARVPEFGLEAVLMVAILFPVLFLMRRRFR